MTQFTHQVVIRVTEELHRWLVEDAREHGRSMTQSARFYLELARRAGGK